MMHELLKKYKLLKIKYQFIIDVFNFFSIYLLFLMLLIISEMTFYHSSMIRYQFYLIIIGLPSIFTNGFPGNREDLYLAGMITETFCSILTYSFLNQDLTASLYY